MLDNYIRVVSLVQIWSKWTSSVQKSLRHRKLFNNKFMKLYCCNKSLCQIVFILRMCCVVLYCVMSSGRSAFVGLVSDSCRPLFCTLLWCVNGSPLTWVWSQIALYYSRRMVKVMFSFLLVYCSFCSSVRPTDRPTVRPSVWLSVCMTDCLSVHLPA